MIYAMDTNTIIRLLNHDKSVVAKRDVAVMTGNQFIIPPVVDYEIRRGLLYRPSPKKENLYNSFRNYYGVGSMTSEMWTKAVHVYVDLRRKGFTVGDDDIFIAAFCLVGDYKLITRNIKDFENIDRLQYENWIDA